LPALDKALGELLGKLRITRVDYKAPEGSYWDVLYRWAPEAVREGVNLSVQQALSALLSKYLECVVAAEQTELESFFGKICGAVAREGICECAAGGARVEFCAREWTVDAARLRRRRKRRFHM